MKLSYLGTPSLSTRRLKRGGGLRRNYCPMFLPPRRAPSSFTTFVIMCTLMLYPQSQTHGTGEYLPFQGATEDQGTRAMDGNARPVCVYCSKDFGRIQELKRHVKEKHMPRRRCPWCDFLWTRPDKIKFHLLSNHAERFTAEVLEGIKALCGRRFVEFVDAYDHGNDVEAISRPVVVVQDPLSHSDLPAQSGANNWANASRPSTI
jgi:hypothetical protein